MEGDKVTLSPDASPNKLYRTTGGELGTDATNPAWIQNGQAGECEYGIYPLTTSDMEMIEKCQLA